jgi:hypothetical protein
VKVETVSSKTSLTLYQYALCHIQGDCSCNMTVAEVCFLESGIRKYIVTGAAVVVIVISRCRQAETQHFK